MTLLTDNVDVNIVKDHQLSTEHIDSISYLFDLLSDPTRLKILYVLCHIEDSVTNIASLVNMSSPAVSHHLRFLKQANLIENKRIGKEVHYKIATNEKAILVHKMIDAAFNMHCKI